MLFCFHKKNIAVYVIFSQSMCAKIIYLFSRADYKIHSFFAIAVVIRSVLRKDFE